MLKFGSPAFWKFYDRFCRPENLDKLIIGKHPMIGEMEAIIKVAHQARDIYLPRARKGWEVANAWLILRNAPIRRDDGSLGMSVRIGDVFVVAHQWDRDVFITHVPVSSHISGYLLKGRWEDMVGLFMPLYDKATIAHCVKCRLDANRSDAEKDLEKNAKEWDWPIE